MFKVRKLSKDEKIAIEGELKKHSKYSNLFFWGYGIILITLVITLSLIFKIPIGHVACGLVLSIIGLFVGWLITRKVKLIIK